MKASALYDKKYSMVNQIYYLSNHLARHCTTTAPVVLLALLIGISPGWPTRSHADGLPDQSQCRMLWDQGAVVKPIIEGWCLMIDTGRGNCLACHAVSTDLWPKSLAQGGNAGPVLESISTKFTDRRDLQRLIDDPATANPESLMPPYGKHRILDDRQIGLIVKFLMTL